MYIVFNAVYHPTCTRGQVQELARSQIKIS